MNRQSVRTEEARIAAVVVTYHPNHARLAELLEAVECQVEVIILVDNGSPDLAAEGMTSAFPEKLQLHKFPVNEGLASAQNFGARLAKRSQATHVLFLDQDSVPSTGMVTALLAALERLQSEGVRVACIGPRFRTQAGGDASSFSRLGWFGTRRSAKCAGVDDSVECDFIISSGSLVPMPVLEAVGGMEDRFFIDQIDTEWCMRARSMGYQVFGACGAVLEHRLGETFRRIWFGRWRRLFRHKPFRYYYIFRNTVALCRRDYVDANFVLFQVRWLLALFIAYGLFGGRSGDLKMMVKGLSHGLRGITGKLN